MINETYIKDIEYIEERFKLIEYIEHFCKTEDFTEPSFDNDNIAPWENNEVKSLDYFATSLSNIKKQAQDVYSQDKSLYSITIPEHKLLIDIQNLQFYINQYFYLKGNKVLSQIHMQKYQKQLDDIFTNINNKTSREINKQLEKFLKGYNQANFNNFDKSILDDRVVSIILKFIENQISKGYVKQIDLSLITKYGMEKELLHSIKSIVLERAKTQEKADAFSYIELFNKLDINELTSPELWKKIFGIDNAEILVVEPTTDNKDTIELDSIKNEPISLNTLKSALFSEKELYKIFKVMRNSNTKYSIGVVYEYVSTNEEYKSIRIPFTFSKFKKLIQNCDIQYTLATVNENTGKYENLRIEFGRMGDFYSIPPKIWPSIVEININAENIPCCFSLCKNLEKVTIDNIKEISNHAFCDCVKLKTVHLGNSIKTIGNYAFYQTALEEIIIPDSIETLEDKAFSYCSNLKTAHLGNSIKTIGNACFYYSDIEEIIIPDSIETLGDNAFSHCSNLKTAHLGNGIKTIGNGCFSFTAIREINIPNSTEVLGKKAFYICEELQTAHLGNGIKSIGKGCFCGTSINKLFIPEDKFRVDDNFIFYLFKDNNRDIFFNPVEHLCYFPETNTSRWNVDHHDIDVVYISKKEKAESVVAKDIAKYSVRTRLLFIDEVPISKKEEAAEVVSKDIANCIKKDQATR